MYGNAESHVYLDDINAALDLGDVSIVDRVCCRRTIDRSHREGKCVILQTAHDLDLIQKMEDEKLDVYGRIKLINYIRKQVSFYYIVMKDNYSKASLYDAIMDEF